MATAPPIDMPYKANMKTAPPIDRPYTDYHRTILNLEKEHGRSPTIQEVANALRLNPDDKNVHDKIQIVKDIISNAREELQADAHRNFLNTGDEFLKGGKYRKSRRHAKKSRRHAKKSRRHAKKSRK
jgi:DNA-directed RNA polymerase specialized sigma subunit